MNIFSKTYDQVAQELDKEYSKGSFHAASLYREIFKKGNRRFFEAPEISASKQIIEKLSATVKIPSLNIISRQSDDTNVTKFASKLSDNQIIETVIIPAHNRTTLCVSSQVGCAMGCTMCVTGKTGFVRDLLPEEIIGQLFAARFEFNRKVDNVVFMGMGEPLDNFDNVIQAVRVMNDQRGFDIALRAITISTSGNVAGIKKLAAVNLPQLRFAVSINAADDDLRNQLMPINKRYPLAVLKEALSGLPLGKDGVILIEYVLLAGVNDSPEMADKLAAFASGLRVRVNIIAFNKSDSLSYQAPSPEDIRRFCDRLIEHKIFVRIRKSYGQSISAACGQLRGEIV